ncbi:MAG: F0F1 ATP synthase subunit epsilon [Nitrospiraceae bacterium]|nr:F0F1 ATP synthase subunit epsilon [Nitrospiraceae bacterium]
MAEGKVLLEIVTPQGLVFSEEVDEVTATGSEGEFGVLPGHVPFVTTLKIGVLACKKGSESKYFFVNWGYAEVGAEKVMILADSAERSEDIDLDRAMAAKKRAEERLKHAENVDFARAEAAIERAVMRSQVVESRRGK